MSELLVTLGIVVALFGLFFFVAGRASWGRVRRDRDEVVALLRAFARGELDEERWQAFLASPIPDGELDRVRKACLFLEEEYPAEVPGERCSAEGRQHVRTLLVALDPSIGLEREDAERTRVSDLRPGP